MKRPRDHAALTAENKVLKLKTRLLDRLPFCPDHRDKVAGKPCRECQIEHLKRLLGTVRDQHLCESSTDAFFWGEIEDALKS